MSPRNEKRSIIVILALFVLVSLTYSIINPPFEATDELRHFRFVRSLVENRTLPVQGEERCRSQSHHPPLYYALTAAVVAPIDVGKDLCDEPVRNPFWAFRFGDVGTDNKNQYFYDQRAPWDNEHWAVQLARMVNIVIGAATVWLTWKIGRILTPNIPAISLTAASIVAFNPMFNYMSGAINNDIIAAFSSTWLLLLCVELLHANRGLSWQWGVKLGLVFGIALLSKFNNAALLAVVSAEMLYIAYRRRQWRGWLMTNVMFGMSAMMVSGWWFMRNQRVYGEPTGVQRLTELWGVRDPRDSFGLAVSELPQTWSTLWGRFGFGQIPLPSIIYQLLFVGVVIGLVGSLHFLLQAVKRKARTTAEALVVIYIYATLFAVVTFYYMLISPAGAMGRFYFPGFPALACLLAVGWYAFVNFVVTSRNRITGRHDCEPRQQLQGFAPLPQIGMPLLLLTLFALLAYLRPAYAMPNVNAAAGERRITVDVENMGRLIDYQVDRRQVEPGGSILLDLTWFIGEQPPLGDFVMFVHLRDAAGFVAQRDSYTGTGAFPSSQWRVGDRFTDQIELFVPETAYVPNSAELTIGFYDPVANYRVRFSNAKGEDLGTSYRLETIAIGSQATEPSPQDFGNEIELVDYQFNQRLLERADLLEVTVQWRALVDVSADYELQMLLLDEAEHYRGSADISPDTTAWRAGQTYTTVHSFDLDQLPSNLDAGSHLLRVAVQNNADGIKLPHLHPSGSEIGEYLPLAPIRIVDR